MEWQPIATAPKDGTVVDLWLVDETGKGWRETDAYYVTDHADEVYEWSENGIAMSRIEQRDGWWAPNHDYDGMDGWCDQPRRYNAHPTQQKWYFRTPTHWMPLPAAPEPK